MTESHVIDRMSLEQPESVKAEHGLCAYCGARPTWPVTWSFEDGSSYTIYLCERCDQQEMMLEDD